MDFKLGQKVEIEFNSKLKPNFKKCLGTIVQCGLDSFIESYIVNLEDGNEIFIKHFHLESEYPDMVIPNYDACKLMKGGLDG